MDRARYGSNLGGVSASATADIFRKKVWFTGTTALKKGMALVYARVYCKLKSNDAAAVEMAKANTGNATRDALAHYAPQFNAARMGNESAGVNTLRHLFVLLTGLGMRESSLPFMK